MHASSVNFPMPLKALSLSPITLPDFLRRYIDSSSLEMKLRWEYLRNALLDRKFTVMGFLNSVTSHFKTEWARA